MPENRLERTRRAYDGVPGLQTLEVLHVRFTESSDVLRAYGEDALALFDSAGSGWIRDVLTDTGFTANVIEAEIFETDRDPGDETPWGV